MASPGYHVLTVINAGPGNDMISDHSARWVASSYFIHMCCLLKMHSHGDIHRKQLIPMNVYRVSITYKRLWLQLFVHCDNRCQIPGSGICCDIINSDSGFNRIFNKMFNELLSPEADNIVLVSHIAVAGLVSFGSPGGFRYDQWRRVRLP